MKGKISAFQLITLLFCCRIFSALNYIPGNKGFSDSARSLTAILIAAVLWAIMLIPYLCLYRKNREDNIIMSSIRYLGKGGGAVAGAVYYLYLLFFAVITLGGFERYMTTVVYFNAPALLISFLIIIVCGYAAYLGIETTGRTSLFAALMLAFNVIIMFVFLFKQIEPANLYIAAPAGSGGLLKEVLAKTAENSDLVIIALILPRVKSKSIKGILFYLLSSLIALEILGFLTITVFGRLSENLQYPIYILEIFNHISAFKNINIIHTLPWVFTAFIKLTVYLIGFDHILHFIIPNRVKAISIPINIALVLAGTYLFAGNTAMFAGAFNPVVMFWVLFGLITAFPAFLLMLYYMRKNSGKGLRKKQMNVYSTTDN